MTAGSGPRDVHVPIHRQILRSYNESAVLVAFHPSLAVDGATTGGKLPLTIYESAYETDGHRAAEDAAKRMDVEGEGDAGQMSLRFRELPYSIDTGEAEMISVDFVARGGGNASAVNGEAKSTAAVVDSPSVEGKGKGKESAVPSGSAQANTSAALTPEDEERG